MIRNLIELLKLDDHYGISERVDIAKGKYKAKKNMKEVREHFKRVINGKG
jgi:hypothetical protein|tara:strand:+ start:620 stop:769 length:150 start_codon:yes stop_codon:yes gene_type:complete